MNLNLLKSQSVQACHFRPDNCDATTVHNEAKPRQRDENGNSDTCFIVLVNDASCCVPVTAQPWRFVTSWLWRYKVECSIYHHATNDAQYYYNLDDMTVHQHTILMVHCTLRAIIVDLYNAFACWYVFSHFSSWRRSANKRDSIAFTHLRTACSARTSSFSMKLQERLVYQDKGIITRLNGKSTPSPIKSIGFRFVKIPMEALAVLRHRRHLRGTRTRWDTDLLIDCSWDFQTSIDSQPTIFLYEAGS